MARRFLTIQKKFALILLAVGMTPAIVGLVISAVVVPYDFERYKAGRLRAFTDDVAGRFYGELGEFLRDRAPERLEELKQIVEVAAGDAQALRAEIDRYNNPFFGRGRRGARTGRFRRVDVIARYSTREGLTAQEVDARDEPLAARVNASPEAFRRYYEDEALRREGFFGLDVRPGGTGMLVFGCPEPAAGEGMAFFLTRIDETLLAMAERSSLRDPGDAVNLFALGTGALIADGTLTEGIVESMRELLADPETPMDGGFDDTEGRGGPLAAKRLVAYSLLRDLDRDSEAIGLDAPPAVMGIYDMEEGFLGHQVRGVWATVIAGLIWAMLLILLSAFMTWRIVGPIKRLRRQAEAMASGDLTARARIASGDEIQDLSDSFNRMAAELQESHQGLERKVEERTHDLERANQKLIQTEKYAATGRLAANLAHEINNPLGIIKNYLRLVRTKMENGEGGRRATDPNLDHMGIIDEEIGRIARIVRQLLDLHRPPEQEVKRTDVGALLSDLVALMEPDLTKSGIEVKCELDPDLPRIMVAPDLIRQVFINLLRNAQDAMEKGGTLTVRAEARPKSDGREAAIVVTVADTGTGIEEGDMGRIFDPFFSTKAPEKGTGLGLAVSYSIVRVYQGSIDVRSEPGNGTTMTVTLPVEAKAEVNPA